MSITSYHEHLATEFHDPAHPLLLVGRDGTTIMWAYRLTGLGWPHAISVVALHAPHRVDSLTLVGESWMAELPPGEQPHGPVREHPLAIEVTSVTTLADDGDVYLSIKMPDGHWRHEDPAPGAGEAHGAMAEALRIGGTAPHARPTFVEPLIEARLL